MTGLVTQSITEGVLRKLKPYENLNQKYIVKPMILTLKKTTTHIDVFYTNHDFSHNLSCSDFKFINGQEKSIEFSFENILKSRADSNSKDDLKDFIENKEKIETISFSDKTLRKSLIKKFQQNEKIEIKIIAGKIINLEMIIVFRKFDEFEFKKPAANTVQIS